MLGPCCEQGCDAFERVRELSRLLADPADAKNVSGEQQKGLIAAFLHASHRAADLYDTDPLLADRSASIRGGALLGCLFDLCTNLEYVSRSTLPDTWLACSGGEHPASSGKIDVEREEELLGPKVGDPSLPEDQNRLEGSLAELGSLPGAHSGSFKPQLYFSFLRACPRCSYHWAHIPPVPKQQVDGNWCKRISVRDHKPGSGPIGDITSAVMGLLVQMLLKANGSEFTASYVTKQNHPVDLVLSSAAALVVTETKASPLVTYPLAASAPFGLTDHSDRIPLPAGSPVSLYVPHRDWYIPLGIPDSSPWPFDTFCDVLVSSPETAVRLVSSWYQLFLAYQVPKPLRRAQVQQLSYLTNGWGDNTDSNKTKAGLGRSDDMKKGTYQMLHFGALFRNPCIKRAVLVALLSNMDPVNMDAEYLQPFQDILWTAAEGIPDGEGHVRFPADRVHRLYDGIITFNRMHPSTGPLAGPLDLAAFWRDVVASGQLDSVQAWAARSS
jgi:hypothetical protein